MTVRAIVLSGGGVKGAFQVGALLRAFDDHQLTGDAWFGVSTGNLTAALCAQSRTHAGQRHLLEKARTIYHAISGNGDIYRGSRWWPVLAWKALKQQALFDPAPLAALLRRHISPERLAVGVPFSCGVVELESGEYVRFEGTDPHVLDAILASASMPVYFPPVQIGGRHYIDGGIRDQTPLREAVAWLKAHPDPDKEVWVYLTSPLDAPRATGPWRTATTIGARCLSLALHEIYEEDVADLRLKNHRPGYACIKATVVQPPVVLGDALTFDPEQIRRMMAMGYHTPTAVPRV